MGDVVLYVGLLWQLEDVEHGRDQREQPRHGASSTIVRRFPVDAAQAHQLGVRRSDGMKACARCGGMMLLSSDRFGTHEHCLMCGRYTEIPASPAHPYLQRAEARPEPQAYEQRLAAAKERKREYQRKYVQRPGAKERRREYRQREHMRQRE